MEIYNIVSAGLSFIGYLQSQSPSVAKDSSVKTTDRAEPGSVVKNSSATTTNRTEPESIWRKLAEKYDVRSMTTEDTARLSQELYNAGEISLLDHALLSFDQGRIPVSTQDDDTGRRDLLAEYEGRVAMDLRTRNHRNLANDERILGYLKRLDAAQGNPIHITV